MLMMNLLNARAQRVLVNGATSDWQPATSSVLRTSLLLQLVLVNIFINDLDARVECEIY